MPLRIVARQTEGLLLADGGEDGHSNDAESSRASGEGL